MNFMIIPAYYKKEIKLNQNIIDLLKNKSYKKIGLFASVQFIKLNKVIEELKKNNFKILTSKTKRTSDDYQILGCDCYTDSYENNFFNQIDCILYIGDGYFHPNALLYAMINSNIKKEVIIYDPINDNIKILTINHLIKNIKKYKANLLKYLSSQKIGILVTKKPGQSYMKLSLRLKEFLESKNKKAYLFYGDVFDFREFENYKIDCWVNTACPRIGYDDIVNINSFLINVKDAFDPEKSLIDIEKILTKL